MCCNIAPSATACIFEFIIIIQQRFSCNGEVYNRLKVLSVPVWKCYLKHNQIHTNRHNNLNDRKALSDWLFYFKTAFTALFNLYKICDTKMYQRVGGLTELVKKAMRKVSRIKSHWHIAAHLLQNHTACGINTARVPCPLARTGAAGVQNSPNLNRAFELSFRVFFFVHFPYPTVGWINLIKSVTLLHACIWYSWVKKWPKSQRARVWEKDFYGKSCSAPPLIQWARKVTVTRVFGRAF